jgi:hypothetical protein
MTYRPAEALFGPPFVVRVPSFIYLGLALSVLAMVALAEVSAPDTWLNRYFVQADRQRLFSSWTFAGLLVTSAVAYVIRAGMRGVRVRGDGLEYRDVINLWPRMRRYKWAQIDRITLDVPKGISLDLWDGTRTFLPVVSDTAGLATTLEKVAVARAIPLMGGKGIDEIPESGEYADEE